MGGRPCTWCRTEEMYPQLRNISAERILQVVYVYDEQLVVYLLGHAVRLPCRSSSRSLSMVPIRLTRVVQWLGGIIPSGMYYALSVGGKWIFPPIYLSSPSSCTYQIHILCSPAELSSKMFRDFETRKPSSEPGKVDTVIGDSFEAVPCLWREDR